MIKSFNTLHCGIFNEADSIDNSTKFSKLNLIYGFNGSGKSTFSRVLNSIAHSELNASFPDDTNFECLIGDVTFKSMSLEDTETPPSIVVYNRDFIDECIRFNDASLDPVVLIGKEMIETEQQLSIIRDEIETLKTDIASLKSSGVSDLKEIKARKKELAASICETANYKNFNAGHLDRFIDDNPHNSKSAEAVFTQACKRAQLKEPKTTVSEIELDFNFYDWVKTVSSELAKSPKITVLEDLSEDGKLLQWVSDGLEVHEDRNQCGFCSNIIPIDRMSNIRHMISGEYQNHQARLKIFLERSDRLPSYFDSIRSQAPTDGDLYSDLESDIKAAKPELYEALDALRDLSRDISKLLRAKLLSPASPIDSSDLEQSALALSLKVEAKLSSLNNVVSRHNLKADSFADDTLAAQRIVTSHIVSKDFNPIKELSDTLYNNAQLQKNKSERIDVLRAKETAKLSAMSDFGPGAETINKMLLNYLRHDEFSLKVLDDGYRLVRKGGKIALSLSEGEKTAISLCYFLSKLSEGDGSRNSKIVVLDDPISSLDSKAKSYALNLIKSKCEDCLQLFILTHDLHFMNESKKWLKKAERKHQKKHKGQDILPLVNFMVLETKMLESDTKRRSQFKSMPNLLKDNDSEYQYVFRIVMNFAESNGDYEFSDYFLIPNLIRKVLEIFFAFRFPEQSNPYACISQPEVKDLDVDEARVSAMLRLADVESHGDSVDHLISLAPIAREEAREAASTCMEVLKLLDQRHYEKMRSRCRV